MDAFEALVDRKPATDTVVLVADPDDAQRLAKARLTLSRAEARAGAARSDQEKAETGAEVDDAETALDDLKATIATLTFHLQGIGPHLVEELMVAHPATKAQKAKARKANGGAPGNVWDDDLFPPALLALSIVKIVHSDPAVDDTDDIDLAKATALWSSRGTSVADKSLLFLTALGLDQRGSGVGDLGND